jgi:hypothetical protein
VDPFKADSFTLVNVDTDGAPVGPNFGVTSPVDPVYPTQPEIPHPDFGPPLPLIPDIPPNILPPPKPRAAGIIPAAIGDLPFVGGVHGDIAFRGANGWQLLTPGLAGQILKTNGGGADPSWQDA